ncbi:MAG TPA: DUF1592 domain-containing protein [Polyangia bacterium]|nr:DUF1592 domain-containing protein [Polyangia bacterium]
MLVALVLSLGACVGHFDGDREGPTATGGKGPPVVVPPPGKDDDPITGPIASAPGPSSRLVRLNHKQWANTVGDLFRLGAPATQAKTFLSESVRSSFDNNGSMLEVSPELWQDYQKAAEAVANQVARDPKLLAGLVPSSAPGDAAGKVRALVQNLGLRAYRRPLTDVEVSRYVNLFNQGPSLIGSMDAFADGAELLITYLLQSPHFLYRAELSTGAVAGKVPLGDYEVASRLSYGLANTMPDDQLLAAAAARKLHTREDVQGHAQRLLASPRGQETLRDFHEQLFHTASYSTIKRDPMRQPAFTPGLGDAMRQESQTFINDVVFARDKGVTELLTARYTFANSKLAALYGAKVPAPAAGDPFVRLELDPGQRAGLFTQIGFLGSNDNATDTTPRPIMRGKHMNLDVLCTDLPSPPNVPPLPPMSTGKTNRELIAAFTEQPGSICVSCHGALINPLGFAFEHYDAVGRWRDTDNGSPVDATGNFEFTEGKKSFDGALELMDIVSKGRQAHECYARRLFEYLYGRDMTAGSAADGNLIQEVGRRSRLSASVKAMVLDLLTTDAFLARLP